MTVITSKGALLFIVVASAMLLLMYFLVNNTWFALVMVGHAVMREWLDAACFKAESSIFGASLHPCSGGPLQILSMC